jgi:hypothetical protein
MVDEMKSILNRDSAGPPHEEVLNLIEEGAASTESDEEVLDLTEELIPRQTQDAPFPVEPGPEKQGQADVSANNATESVEVSLTDFIGEIQKRIDEALAPLKNDNYERVLTRTGDLNPAQITPADAPLIVEPDPTSAEQARATASTTRNSSTTAAAKGSLTEFQIEAKMIGEIQRQITAALTPLKANSCDAAEEVLDLTEELIPGQTWRDDSRVLAETEPENVMQAGVFDNLPRNSSIAARVAEGSLTESDVKTNQEIQRQIDEALAPLKNGSRYGH